MAALWYPLGCVLVPCVIGIVMYFGFEAWERRRRAGPPENELPIIDYSI
jgi:hypothetical protein